MKIARDGQQKYSYCFPEGVFLVHLKFASIAALAKVNEARKEVARSGVPGVPGWGWKRADAHAMRFFEKSEELKFASWSDALRLAYQQIPTDMKFDENDGVIRSPGIPFLAKTKLPKWFKEM